jgi:putative hydrolase of the HAD superfamily
MARPKYQVGKAEAVEIHHLVDRIFTSEQAGCCKPNRGIFKFALGALGASPTMTYMVGDSVDADINDALGAGMNAILYSPTA